MYGIDIWWPYVLYHIELKYIIHYIPINLWDRYNNKIYRIGMITIDSCLKIYYCTGFSFNPEFGGQQQWNTISGTIECVRQKWIPLKICKEYDRQNYLPPRTCKGYERQKSYFTDSSMCEDQPDCNRIFSGCIFEFPKEWG